MHDRESAGPGNPAGPEAPDVARARLASALRATGRTVSTPVQRAFAQVPRHVFVPEVGPSAAYRDEAFVIKCGSDGLPVSSSSQPAMMAIMLDQLGLQPGDRVLEIGTGSGYNAAVMSAVVGSAGQVVSVDIDPELVTRARSSLRTAGYDDVIVRCADGGYGDPAHAPFDKIIVTAGAWDIAPAWLAQLGPAGRLVLPLSVRGIQLSTALQRRGAGWVSMSAFRCGFVRMLGAFAGPEQVLHVDRPHPLYVQISDGSPADAMGLAAALGGPVTDVPQAAELFGAADLADLDLWLTLARPELDRVTVVAAPGGWLPLAQFLPFGGLVCHAMEADKVGIALLLPGLVTGIAPAQSGHDGEAAGTGLVLRGYGPGGAELAASLAGQVPDWAARGRPGVRELRMHVLSRGPRCLDDRDDAANRPDTLMIIDRPSARIELSWAGR
jgi:protein-L-isoaspartate(D-aspartate) O-methyltransferase